MPVKVTYTILNNILTLDDDRIIKIICKPLNTVLNAMIYGSVAAKMFLSNSLSLLWGMVNALQLIVHVPLFSLPLPSNMRLFLSSLMNVLTFDSLSVQTFH